MIYGIGIDIENPERFKKYLSPDVHILPVYTNRELENYSRYNNHLCFAFSFCFKEAVFKALGGNKKNTLLSWTEAELIFLDKPEHKKVEMYFSGKALKTLKNNNLQYYPKINFYTRNKLCIFETIFYFNKKK